jgi:hypothetical protein
MKLMDRVRPATSATDPPDWPARLAAADAAVTAAVAAEAAATATRTRLEAALHGPDPMARARAHLDRQATGMAVRRAALDRAEAERTREQLRTAYQTTHHAGLKAERGALLRELHQARQRAGALERQVAVNGERCAAVGLRVEPAGAMSTPEALETWSRALAEELSW